MGRPRDEALEQDVIKAWRAGLKNLGELAEKIGRGKSAVSVVIKRLRAEKRWPFEDGPAGRGGAHTKTAGKARRSRRTTRPTTRSTAPAGTDELAGLHGMLAVRIPARLMLRLRQHAASSGQSQARTVAEALDSFLKARGA